MNIPSRDGNRSPAEVVCDDLPASPRRVNALPAVAAIVVVLACFHGHAGESEKSVPKRSAPSGSNARAPSANSAENPNLRQELLARMAEDQGVRKQWLGLLARPQQPEDAEKQIKLIQDKLHDVDRKNLVRMKQIVKRFGWPGKSLVGSDGAQAAWLLVQHADADVAFQKRCLALIIAAVKQGEASPEQMAYLTDRVRVAERKKQVYGTQFHEVNGKQEPFPIENEAQLDHRRKEVGMPPMAEYRKLIDQMYPRGKPKKSGQAGITNETPTSPPPRRRS